MEQHVKQFGDTRREQRARATAKDRELLKQEITPAHFMRPEAKRDRSSASGGVTYTVPVNGISSEEAMRFGLDSSNPGYKMMCDSMGWKGGPIGKLNDGIATALTGKSIGGQTNRSGVGTRCGCLC